jgi:hypothetical protein
MTARSASAFAVVLCLGFFAVGAAASGAEPPTGNRGPFALTVPATNGYRASVIAAFDAKLGRGEAILTLFSAHGSATYATPAVVGETSIDASFGALGEIDVHSVPTGETVTEPAPCGGGEPATFPGFRWEGTIRFRGEEGFTTVDATSAKAAVSPILGLICTETRSSEGIGGHSPGALLELRRRHGTEHLEFQVRKNKRTGPSSLHAAVSERRGSISIMRSVSAVGPSRAFDFAIPPGVAAVRPPAPFSGSLRLARHPGSPPLARGNLKVDFPGRARVPVLGPGPVHASLIRAVLNPSHPF